MSDVRILAPLAARGTGIPRTSTQVPQRDPAAAANTHVSASPSAGARVHAQVASARRPAGLRQDAPTVTILDRRTPTTGASPVAQPAPTPTSVAKPPATASQFPTVQIVDRPRPAAAAPLFSVEQMMLIGHLLDRYRENTLAIQDTENMTIAEGALAVLGGLLQAHGVPTEAATAPPAPARSADGRTDASAAERSIGSAADPIVPSPGPDGTPSSGTSDPSSRATSDATERT
jgi:hypothetical protein